MQAFQLKNINLFIFCLSLSPLAFSHSIDERYDLPLPLDLFIYGSGAVVFFSFLGIFLLFTKVNHQINYSFVIFKNISKNNFWRLLKIALQICSCILFFVILGACFWGNPNPLDNLAPNFIWITWWLGFSICIGLFGDFWPLVNPWIIIFNVLEKFIFPHRSLIASNSTIFSNTAYIATFFLFLWSWLEVVYPVAFVPKQIGYLIIIWTVISFTLMLLYGKLYWKYHIDFFSIYFSILGKFGLFAYDYKKDSLIIRPLGFGLSVNITNQSEPKGLSAFIIAMLSTVLFDGLHGNQVWIIFELFIENNFSFLIDANRYVIGTIGLFMTWLIFFSVYQLSCWVSQKLCPSLELKNLADRLALSLIPIAIAYLVAHNFSSFVIQVQNIVYLISDPFHRGWNIFNTVNFRPNIAILDAGFTWYLALSSIVIGHIMAIFICHFMILKITNSKKEIIGLSLPITFIMVLLTMMSLIIIAEPMTNSAPS